MSANNLFFYKYHALGNDYIVIEHETAFTLDYAKLAKNICDRHYGLGSDGILVTAKPDNANAAFFLRIFNPDGSEAEKSGNGIRIYCRYLFDTHQVGLEPFILQTLGGLVRCQILDNGQFIYVEMGKAQFLSTTAIHINEINYPCLTVSIGNPHCVLPVQSPTKDLAMNLGPLIENHPLFPERTNVQFINALDKHQLQIEIWERGAGYTLASGSSSCAAAAAAVKLGLCEAGEISVLMPGGKLLISVDSDFNLTMTGPVTAIASGKIAAEIC